MDSLIRFINLQLSRIRNYMSKDWFKSIAASPVSGALDEAIAEALGNPPHIMNGFAH
jgi:hypothetical protein